ncbi:MAG: uroporphyrinogen-III C-methyltransferase [Thermoanaerobaculia bacterium]|nr:uroporphyrinogen-III C-methyltransferase [Thermoanaerobaculia bacterium]
MRPGLVSLVGAGPGDCGLITLAGARHLAEAELVLYDALVAEEILSLAPNALRVPVGKRAGRPSASQASIERLMIRAARRGRRVVRLKGGDPFVLGRGGEEALALAAAGVPFEVVPGVSSAVAAPGLAGIPLTHRGLSSAFVVVSGHSEESFRPVLEGLAPSTATLVVLMGLGQRKEIVSLLLRSRWKPATPAAICAGASTPESTLWTGRLDELADVPQSHGLPGTIVIGEVVELSAEIGSQGVRHQPEAGQARIYATRT